MPVDCLAIFTLTRGENLGLAKRHCGGVKRGDYCDKLWTGHRGKKKLENKQIEKEDTTNCVYEKKKGGRKKAGSKKAPKKKKKERVVDSLATLIIIIITCDSFTNKKVEDNQ